MLNYYLSGNDAFRLKLYIPENQPNEAASKENNPKEEQQVKK
jgi:hypothetical protein